MEKTVYLMRMNEEPITDKSVMALLFEYGIRLNTIDFCGFLMNVTGDIDKIRAFKKRFKMKYSSREYYEENCFGKGCFDIHFKK